MPMRELDAKLLVETDEDGGIRIKHCDSVSNKRCIANDSRVLGRGTAADTGEPEKQRPSPELPWSTLIYSINCELENSESAS